ncbi:MAG: hypothetical protein J7L34_00585 [Thermotogaceae bacterium]|nr:hypothetical protein [Thermotogaceae bacterium]
MADPVFEHVVKSCIEDSRLLDIVRNVARMSEEEKSVFLKKASLYFMNKSSEEDIEAYKFFKFILQENNAKGVLERVKEYERGSR